jgi:hypothetical protein
MSIPDSFGATRWLISRVFCIAFSEGNGTLSSSSPMQYSLEQGLIGKNMPIDVPLVRVLYYARVGSSHVFGQNLHGFAAVFDQRWDRPNICANNIFH